MRINSNQRAVKFAGGVLAFSLFIPLSVFGQTSTATSTPRGAVIRAKLCERVLEVTSVIEREIKGREKMLETRRAERNTELSDKRNEHKEKREERRGEQNDRLDAHIAKLLEKADTDVERQAIAEFKSAVGAARVARQATVDAARHAFQGGVDAAIAARKSATDLVVKEYKDAVAAALAKAKADCAAGIDPRTARETLAEGLRAARDEFQSDRKKIENTGDAVTGLVKVRQEAIKKAFDEYRAAVEAAAKDLKDAFGGA